MYTIKEALIDARRRLATGDERELSLIAYMLRDWPETEAADLRALAHLLAMEEYGCSYQDVLGLIEYLEAYLAKNNA